MRDHPHPRALFSLVPLTGEAKQVLNYAGNKHLVSRLVDGRLAIDVGHLPFKSASILATLGRAEDATIKVPHPRISKIQCTFEINLDSRIIMLYDRSSGSSTQSQGSNAFPFEFGRPYRRIALMKGINERIGFGGPSHDLFLFKIHWHQTTLQQTVKKLEALATVPRDYADELQQDPMNAHTVDEPNTVLPSRVETSVQTLGNLQRTLRYVGLEALGQGAYGEVHKAVDIDSGRLVAVKIVRLPAKDVKREVEVLQELVHVSCYNTIFPDSGPFASSSIGWWKTHKM